MMLLDVAPPDFAVVDAWAPVADGPFGVMGCRHPAEVRHVYAGADALAVDEAVLADLGVADPRAGTDRAPRAPLVRAPAAGRPGRRRSGRRSAASCAARTRRYRCARSARCRTRSTCTSAIDGRAVRARDGHRRRSRRSTGRARPRARCAGARSGRSGCARRQPELMRSLAGAAARRRRCRSRRATRLARGARDRRQPRARAVAVPGLGGAPRPARRSCATPRTLDGHRSRHTGATRPDRLAAWLDVGRRAR